MTAVESAVTSLVVDELLEYHRPLIHITPEASLFEAIQMLYKYRVHRLPVIDTNTGNALFIMTHKRILRFLFLYVRAVIYRCLSSGNLLVTAANVSAL